MHPTWPLYLHVVLLVVDTSGHSTQQHVQQQQQQLPAQLSQLFRLHKEGALTAEEFKRAKTKLLSPPPPPPPPPQPPPPSVTSGALLVAPPAVPDFSSQVVSIKAFGARGDGLHDDTRSIQAAIDAATGGTAHTQPLRSVFIPSGVYMITSPLIVTTPVYGETASTSVIKSAVVNGSAFIVMTGYHSVFRDFKISGDCNPAVASDLCQTRDGIVLVINKSYMRFQVPPADF